MKWAKLSFQWESAQVNKFRALEQIIDVRRNFSNYRTPFKKALDEARTQHWPTNKIVIPILSIVLQDVFFIKKGSGDYTSAGGINLQVGDAFE